jgi:hypothetical protein
MQNAFDAAKPFGFDMSNYEGAAAQVREFNERWFGNAKTLGTTALDAYDKALESMLAMEEKVADSSNVEWIATLAHTHVAAVREVAGAYTKAARELLTVG